MRNALRIIVIWPGGGAAGSPELVTHTGTLVPAAAFQMPGAVSVVR
jgi:hypothetical protein